MGFFALFSLFVFPRLTSAQKLPDLLPALDSLDYREMNRIAGGLFEKAGNLESVLGDKEILAGRNLERLDIELENARRDSILPKSQMDSLFNETKTAKVALKKISKLRERALKLSNLIGAMTDMDSLNLRKNLPKAWQQVSQLYDDLYPPPPAEKVEKARPVTDKPITNKPINPLKRFAAYKPSADVMLAPPTPPCSIASSSRDEFSGEISREMARAELFRFTNPALKTYLQGKTHVVCEAALASTGANVSLHLTFTINDPNARKAFGRLDKNSVATIKFMDGSTFNLQNAVPDDGAFNPETEATVFRAQYPLTPEVLKKMRRSELDKLRIAWSNGYDDYEVQQVDLLMRQAECLFEK